MTINNNDNDLAGPTTLYASDDNNDNNNNDNDNDNDNNDNCNNDNDRTCAVQDATPVVHKNFQNLRAKWDSSVSVGNHVLV